MDARLRDEMREEIRRLHAETRLTTIYVTHDQKDALALADRLAVMNAGRVEQVGTPWDLYHRPATRFVAGFLGSPAMSFVAGTVERTGGALSVVTKSGIRLPAPPHDIEAGREVEVGIRPEDFRLSRVEAGIPFVVNVVEPTGRRPISMGQSMR